ncbi:MAG: hypothetical protein HZT41_05735 [Dechloromonas sp.]|nr:MAG: hypothetical protein HZT41_05735 [Dechloromonas sp.]
MPSAEHDIRLNTAASTHIIFGLFIWLLAIAYTYTGITKTASVWPVVAFISAIGIAFHSYYAYLQLNISQGFLSFRTLFSRGSIALKDITRSEFQRNRNRRDPRVFLVIIPANGESALRVNLKPFRLVDIQRLLAMPELRLAKNQDA